MTKEPIRANTSCTHTTRTYPGSLMQPARQRGRVLRLARHAEVQRAERAQEEPRLERAHHVPEVRAVVPQLCRYMPVSDRSSTAGAVIGGAYGWQQAPVRAC